MDPTAGPSGLDRRHEFLDMAHAWAPSRVLVRFPHVRDEIRHDIQLMTQPTELFGAFQITGFIFDCRDVYMFVCVFA